MQEIKKFRIEMQNGPDTPLTTVAVRFEYAWPNSTWSNLYGVNVQCVHLGSNLQPKIIYATKDLPGGSIAFKSNGYVEKSFLFDGFLAFDDGEQVIRCSVQDCDGNNDQMKGFRARDISISGGLASHLYANADLEFMAEPVRVLCSTELTETEEFLENRVAMGTRLSKVTSMQAHESEIAAFSWSVPSLNATSAAITRNITFSEATLVKGVVVNNLCDSFSKAKTLRLEFRPMLTSGTILSESAIKNLNVSLRLMSDCKTNEYSLQFPVYTKSVVATVTGKIFPSSHAHEGWARICLHCSPEPTWKKIDSLNFSYAPLCIPINKTESVNRTRWKIQYSNQIGRASCRERVY
jgi:hypothetical protein